MAEIRLAAPLHPIPSAGNSAAWFPNPVTVVFYDGAGALLARVAGCRVVAPDALAAPEPAPEGAAECDLVHRLDGLSIGYGRVPLGGA